MDFNNFMKSRRKACNLSLEELSIRTNISMQKLAKIEYGCELPSTEGVISICMALEIPLNDMLFNVSFDYYKYLRKCCYRIQTAQHRIDNELSSWDKKIQYIALLRKKQDNINTALIQRKLGVSYREAKALLETINIKE